MPRAFLNHLESDCLCSLFYSYILRVIWSYTEHLLEDGDSRNFLQLLLLLRLVLRQVEKGTRCKKVIGYLVHLILYSASLSTSHTGLRSAESVEYTLDSQDLVLEEKYVSH